MIGRDVAIVGASLTLQHVPDLVRYGSKPRREQERLPQIQAAIRSFSDAVDYPPNQVFIGNAEPDMLRELRRPWWDSAPPGDPHGAFGDIIDQARVLRTARRARSVRARTPEGRAASRRAPPVRGRRGDRRVRPAHESDESLTARVLLENLACKAGRGARDAAPVGARRGVDPTSIPYVIGAGEEAIGDRYQRGGGNLGKAIAEAAGSPRRAGATSRRSARRRSMRWWSPARSSRRACTTGWRWSPAAPWPSSA